MWGESNPKPVAHAQEIQPEEDIEIGVVEDSFLNIPNVIEEEEEEVQESESEEEPGIYSRNRKSLLNFFFEISDENVDVLKIEDCW